MKLRICSDLHTEFYRTSNAEELNSIIPDLPDDKETILIIAGDIGLAHIKLTLHTPLTMLSKRFKYVLWVMGNHFFYSNSIFNDHFAIEEYSLLAPNVKLLENSVHVMDDVLFVGATLWTDFNNSNPMDMLYASKAMSDFRVIHKFDNGVLRPEDTVNHHYRSKDYIFNILRNSEHRKKVVITHHGCTLESIPINYKGDKLNSAFVSDLSPEILRHQPDLWIHGHTHDSLEYYVANTRVLCNPYGYKNYIENENYNPKLVVEV